MKYKKIASFIKKRKELGIHDGESCQWITDGIACYPVLGLPRMTESEMMNFLDLSLSDGINVSSCSTLGVNLSDTDKEEELIEGFGPEIISGGEVHAVFYTSMGAIIVKDKYIQPAYSHEGEGELTFWLRNVSGRPYIAVKKGLYLLAAILPVRTWEEDSTIMDEYKKLYTQLRMNCEILKNLKEEINDE